MHAFFFGFEAQLNYETMKKIDFGFLRMDKSDTANNNTKPNLIMPFFKKNTTYISERMTLTGDLDADVNIVIDGTMRGNIKSTKHVMLGATAHFEGNIESESALICGHVKGRIVTSRLLTIRVPATIIGDVVSASIRIESGVIIQGKILSIPTENPVLSLPEMVETSPSE